MVGRAGFVVVLSAIALTGCALGQRPTLGPTVDRSRPLDRQVFGVPVVDAVLGPLDKVDALTFTAVYRVTNLSTNTTVQATVVHEPIRHSVTVGDVRVIFGERSLVCSLAKVTCTQGDINQPLAATIPSGHEFYSTRPAQQLRVSAARAARDPISAEPIIADQVGSCVVIPLATDATKDETYCVVPTGQLGRVERADVRIELLSYSPETDPGALVALG